MDKTETFKLDASQDWDVASLIDLEFLTENDESYEARDLKKRDRDFYLNLSQTGTLDSVALGKREIVLRHWIEERRASSGFPKPGPGETTDDVLGAIRFWGFLGFLLFGAVFTWGALNIAGKQVNVLLFWFLTVGLPFFFSLMGFYLLYGERFPRIPGSTGILRNFIGGWILAAGSKAVRVLDRKLPQEQRLRMGRMKGTGRKRLYGHGSILAGIFTSLLHLLGLGFVTGIFISICLFRTFSYQDYGWQTHSGWLTDQRVHSLVGGISGPWAWFDGEGSGYPSEAQIRNTRIFRNHAADHEYPAASMSWSSFLLWSSLFYGLLPRLALYVAGRIQVHRAFVREDFRKFDTLWRRMTLPFVIVDRPPPEQAPPTTEEFPVPTIPDQAAQGSEILLIPEDLGVTVAVCQQMLKTPLQNRDLKFSNFYPLPSLPSARNELLQTLKSSPEGRPSRLLIVQESITPSSESFERFLTDIREAFDDVSLHVILIHPTAATGTTQRLAAWKNRLDPLGDPMLSLVAVGLDLKPTPSDP